jgi:Tfp pilus assembly protein PilF
MKFLVAGWCQRSWLEIKSVSTLRPHYPQAQQQAKSLKDAAAALAAQGRTAEAIASMKEALDACGECSFRSELNKNLGLIYARAGDYKNARDQLQRALEGQPNDPEAQTAFNRVNELVG